MPVEKLTKKRLIQLVIMMIILLSAFIYKSCDYSVKQDNKSSVSQQH